MARIWVRLDGPGFNYCSEPGFMAQWSGRELHEAFIKAWAEEHPGEVPPDSKLWIPPGTDVLMPRPRQFSPDWYKDARLDQHVITLASGSYLWNPQVDASTMVKAWNPNNLTNGTNPAPEDEWITVAIPAALDEIIAYDWPSFFAAASGDEIAGYGTVAKAQETPRGELFGERQYAPFIQFLAYPQPDTPVALHFGDLALVCWRDTVSLVQETTLNDEGEIVFKRLDQWGWDEVQHGVSKRYGARFGGGVIPLIAGINTHVRSVGIIPLPPRQVLVCFGSGAAFPVTVRSSTTERILSSAAGGWNLLAAPSTRLTFQVQVMGFEVGDTAAFGTGDANFPVVWDLGANYKPSVDPAISAYGYLFEDPTIPGGPTTSQTPNQWEFLASGYDDRILIDLYDVPGDPWQSDGIKTKGSFHVQLRPPITGNAEGYLAPVLTRIGLKFPAVHAPRLGSELILDDTDFADVEMSWPLGKTEGKFIRVKVWDRGTAPFALGNHDLRTDYPVEILETDDIFGAYVVRAVGWVQSCEFSEYRYDPLTETNVGIYTLEAAGLLSRLDTDWEYVPQMFDPNGNGAVEHSYCVKETLYQAGLDTANTVEVQVYRDPYTGQGPAKMPGEWSQQANVPGLRTGNPAAPDHNRTKREYLDFVKTLRGWIVYEAHQPVQYHPDLLSELLLAKVPPGVAPTYYVSATLYSSHATALAAGRDARQCYQLLPTRSIEPPVANVIKIVPENDTGAPEAVILDRLTDALTETADFDVFTGEPKVKVLKSKLAVSADAAKTLARAALLLLMRRKTAWQVICSLPVWEIAGASDVEVGEVITLEGKGDYLIDDVHMHLVHSRTAALGSSQWLTRLALVKIPAGSTAISSGLRLYPGRMEEQGDT